MESFPLPSRGAELATTDAEDEQEVDADDGVVEPAQHGGVGHGGYATTRRAAPPAQWLDCWFPHATCPSFGSGPGTGHTWRRLRALGPGYRGSGEPGAARAGPVRQPGGHRAARHGDDRLRPHHEPGSIDRPAACGIGGRGRLHGHTARQRRLRPAPATRHRFRHSAPHGSPGAALHSEARRRRAGPSRRRRRSRRDPRCTRPRLRREAAPTCSRFRSPGTASTSSSPHRRFRSEVSATPSAPMRGHRFPLSGGPATRSVLTDSTAPTSAGPAW